MKLRKLKNLKNKIISLLLIISPIACYSQSQFTLTVEGLKNNQIFPVKFVSSQLGGENVSPEVSWANPPEKSKAFVLTCIDKNPVANNWVHWMLINIPPDTKDIPEGFNKAASSDFIICRNSFGYQNYGGPQPPQGTGAHKYVFTLYALNSKIKGVKNSDFVSESQLLKKLKNKILAKAVFTLNYKCQ